jgi:hypothetical protein
MITSGQLKNLHEQVTQRILSSQNSARGSRERSEPNPQLEVEDKVYLPRQELPSQQTTRKMDNDKVRPPSIPEFSGPENYKLRLPGDAKLHPGLHISLLESADLETALLTTFHPQTEEEGDFEVEEILKQRVK